MAIGAFIPWEPAHTSPKHNNPWVGWVIDETGCHLWTGCRDKKGYAVVKFQGKKKFVHRVRYLLEIGPVPEGLELGHYVCNGGPNGCCNPNHCRPVCHRENMLRGDTVAAAEAARTHCPRGHPLSGDNLVGWYTKQGQRRCRLCANQQRRVRHSGVLG